MKCKCKKCDHIERVNFYSESFITLKDICCMLIREYQSKRQIEISRNIREPSMGSNISSSEVKEFLKFLKTSETHEDFMEHIGCKAEAQKKEKGKSAKKKTKNRKQSPRSSDKKNEN